MTLKELMQSYQMQREMLNVEIQRLEKIGNELAFGEVILILKEKSDFFRGVLVDLSELEGVG